MRIETFLLQFHSSTKDSSSLHSGDFGISVTQTATTVTEHRVSFDETVHALVDVFHCHTHCFRHFFLTSLVVRNEFVERRIEETNIYGATIHSAEDAEEVSLLVRKNLRQSLFATFCCFAQNHFAHSNNLLCFEEHMFSAAKTDTNSTEVTSHFCILRSVSVGANLEFCIFAAKFHQFCEVTAQFSCFGLNFSSVNATCCTVQRDEITFFQGHSVNSHRASLVVYHDAASTRNAALTHTTSHNSSVRSHTTTSGENTFSSSHTSEVFGRCFDAYHNHLLTSFVPSFSIVSVEYDLTTSCTRRSGKTASNFLCTSQSLLVEDRVEEFIEFVRFATFDNRLFVDHTFVEKVHCDFHHSRTGALTVTSLQEPKFTFLYGELHILHIAIVLFEFVLERIEFSVDFRHSLFH